MKTETIFKEDDFSVENEDGVWFLKYKGVKIPRQTNLEIKWEQDMTYPVAVDIVCSFKWIKNPK